MNVQENLADHTVTNSNSSVRCAHTTVVFWNAIIAGALVSFGLMFLLQVFDKALGLQIIRAATSETSDAIAWGGFLASIIGIMAVMFFSGWIAGHLAKYDFITHNRLKVNSFSRHYGLLYGLLTWSLGLIISLVFALQEVFLASGQTKTTLFLMFILNFSGAVASCFGGYCGLKTETNEDVVFS